MAAIRIIIRKAVACYSCGKDHQLRLIDREDQRPRTVAMVSGREFRALGAIDAFEDLELAEQLISAATERRAKCPMPTTTWKQVER